MTSVKKCANKAPASTGWAALPNRSCWHKNGKAVTQAKAMTLQATVVQLRAGRRRSARCIAGGASLRSFRATVYCRAVDMARKQVRTASVMRAALRHFETMLMDCICCPRSMTARSLSKMRWKNGPLGREDMSSSVLWYYIDIHCDAGVSDMPEKG